jgi:hypothetical protein
MTEKTYTLSIALDYDPVAETDKEAIEQAQEMIKQGEYSIQIIEKE